MDVGETWVGVGGARWRVGGAMDVGFFWMAGGGNGRWRFGSRFNYLLSPFFVENLIIKEGYYNNCAIELDVTPIRDVSVISQNRKCAMQFQMNEGCR